MEQLIQDLMKSLIAGKLADDPRVAQAKKLLLDAVREWQGQLTGPSPAKAALQEGYNNVISSFAAQRCGKLWFPYLGSGIGRGPLVELLDGSVKYDFIGGIGVHY